MRYGFYLPTRGPTATREGILALAREGERLGLHSAMIAALSLPLVLLGATLGLKLGTALGERWLRPFTYACLIALALTSVLQPILTPIFASSVER